MSAQRLEVEPHVEDKVICECGKIYCTTCMTRCPRCYGLHFIKKLEPNLEVRKYNRGATENPEEN